MRFGVVVAALAAVLAACGAQGPATLTFVEITPPNPRIGETVVVKFSALDSRGLPAEGVPVSFRLQSAASEGAVTLGITEAQTNKSTGDVFTTLVARQRVSSVVVIAESGGILAQSPAISFAGTEVSARGITFQCGPIAGESSGGIHALRVYGPGRNMIAGVRVDCTAHVSDRNGDGIQGALVSFLSEAGTIGPSATSLTNVVGDATVLYKSSFPLPLDVDPGKYFHTPTVDPTHTGAPIAPGWMLPWEWRSNPMVMNPPDPQCAAGCDEPRRTDPVRPGKINNPRDNLVAMIAVTSGEEEFIDANNDGIYQNSETFFDTTEPFVDFNDNGTWDPGELYVDTDGNGSWSGKNGTYDASTLIWAQNHMLWTGIPNSYDYADGAPAAPPPGYVPTIARVAPAGIINIPHLGSSPKVIFRVADPWFNIFAQNDDGDGCRTEATDNVVVLPERFGDVGVLTRYPSVIDAEFVIFDAHPKIEDPDAGAPQASAFAVFPSCRTTSSPQDGDVVEIGLGEITGIVQ